MKKGKGGEMDNGHKKRNQWRARGGWMLLPRHWKDGLNHVHSIANSPAKKRGGAGVNSFRRRKRKEGEKVG